MRKSSIRLYGPFLAVALLQALFIAVAPSKAPDRSAVTAALGPLGSEVGGSDGGVIDPETGLLIDPETGELIDPQTGRAVSGGTGGTGGTTGGGTTGTTGTAGGVAGDTSHCKNGFQFEVLLLNPPCVPKFTGNNGGATYRGVTDKEIKIVIFSTASNAAVDAVLAPQGLAASPAELDAIYAALEKFVEKRYELYGRELKIIRYTGNCETSPPTVAECKESAREVIKMNPFLVVFGTPLYGEVFDEFARAGIPSVGGWHFDDSYFTQRRPYRYDVFMDGTRTARMVGEYYCKKMAGKPADHAGVVIHDTIPGGRLAPRKVAIITPEIDANVRAQRYLMDIISKCDGGKPVVPITYVSDIERANEQTEATTATLIREKVTTIICLCDPIAPAFATAYYTKQHYFPEHLLSGSGLLDYDLLGRLYEPNQWEHAFGPSHLSEPIPFGQTDASRVWRDVGNSGEPCKSCNLHTGYFVFVAGLLQGAGPNLNPLTMEQAVMASKPQGGFPGTSLIKFGPGDYTAISDAREVYWSSSAISKIDGKPGAYISLNNAKRYEIGQWNNEMAIPVKSK
ncbi:MAG: hypothetical protein ACT452_01135 [Microthrixaceae bacterium]